MTRGITLAVAALILAAGAARAQDEPRVYAAPGVNLCPAGLQPVTIDGTISCGTPTVSGSYGAMKVTPAR